MKNVFVILVGLTYLSDVANFFWPKSESDLGVSWIIKSILVILSLFFFLKGDKSLVVLLLLLLILSLFTLFSSPFFKATLLLYYLKEFTKYFLLIFFITYIRQSKISRTTLRSILIYLFSFSLVFPLLGFVFNIEILQTYNGVRFGFKSLFASQNEYAFYLALSIIFTFYNYTKNRDIISMMLLLLSIAAILLSGIKIVVLFLLFFTLYGLFYCIKSFYKICILFSVFVGFVFILLFLLGNITYYIHLADLHGWLYTLSSGRSEYLFDELPKILINSRWHSIFIGDFKNLDLILEMDLIDIFLLWGLIGGLLYLYLLYKVVFVNFYVNRWILISAISFLFIGSLAGHVFASGINALYFAILLVFFELDNISPSV